MGNCIEGGASARGVVFAQALNPVSSFAGNVRADERVGASHQWIHIGQ